MSFTLLLGCCGAAKPPPKKRIAPTGGYKPAHWVVRGADVALNARGRDGIAAG
jgi:hypothetical protein